MGIMWISGVRILLSLFAHFYKYFNENNAAGQNYQGNGLLDCFFQVTRVCNLLKSRLGARINFTFCRKYEETTPYFWMAVERHT